jgi:hypothetical protein
MIRLLPFLLLAAPAWAQDIPHSGVATPRTGPELSDIALAVVAAIGIWFARRAMRKRARSKD